MLPQKDLSKASSPVLHGVTDAYTQDRPAGTVVGSESPGGVLRKGVDTEGILAIDHGALRMGYIRKPGWGRHAIAYGPYARTAGRAFSAFLLNGHNTSQTDPERDGFLHRLVRPVLRKLLLQTGYRWPQFAPKPPIPYHEPPLQENLAVGWFPSEAPGQPTQEGNALIMHAPGLENGGELWVRIGKTSLPTIRDVQNVPMYYVVVLRERGAAYYVASMPQAHAMAPYPLMRPIAIDPFNEDETVYAVITQSVLGETGWHIDTRVYGVQVTEVEALDTWYGTAHVADRLTGHGPLEWTVAEAGGRWTLLRGTFERNPHGLTPVPSKYTVKPFSLNGNGTPQKKTTLTHLALIDDRVPAGLLHVLFDSVEEGASAGVVWRFLDENHFWCFMPGTQGCQLYLVEGGVWNELASSPKWSLKREAVNAVQILDDGTTLSLSLNGSLVFDTLFEDTRLGTATGVGLCTADASHSLSMRHFEAHPRNVPIPIALCLGTPWMPRPSRIVEADTFEGPTGDLTGSQSSRGNIWRREVGVGFIERTGQGAARVRATPQQPNPGRTAYTLPWADETFADLEVTIIPPGAARGQQQTGRGGLFFWQDEDHYLIINNYFSDRHVGPSISSFFFIGGKEDLYRAVWTNVGERIHWGIPHTFRVVFDGNHYIAYINEEPVLYRALTDVFPDIQPLKIRRIGIAANWEFGDDTGSMFRNFVARR